MLDQITDITVLIAVAVVFLLLLIKWHMSKDAKFDVKDIIVETSTGKVSLYKIGQVIALWVSTWIIIHETKEGRLTDWLFLSYMALWSGTNLAKSLIRTLNNNKQYNTELQQPFIETKFEEEPPTSKRKRGIK